MPQISTDHEAPPSPASEVHSPASHSRLVLGWSEPAKIQLWAGRVISAAVTAMMLLSATMKLSHVPPVVAKFTAIYLFPESLISALGILELLCVLVYIIPRTAVLGAVLLTGYLGGAIATHVRAGEFFAIPLLLGGVAWLGIFLREPRLHALLPSRK
jgi:hypothetical protein